MTERYCAPPLPPIENYTNGAFEFVPLAPQTGTNFPPGTVLRFHHKPSGRLSIFECTYAEEGGPAQGWLSRFVDGESSDRMPAVLDSLQIATDPEKPNAQYVDFSSPIVDSKPPQMRFQIAFTHAGQTFAPDISEHLLVHALKTQERAPLETPESQALLRKVVDFFIHKARTNNFSTDGYRIVAQAITDELLVDESI